MKILQSPLLYLKRVVVPQGTLLDGNWTMLNFTLDSSGKISLKIQMFYFFIFPCLPGTSIIADLTPLQGQMPTAVRYAWGVLDCCDHTDPLLYVTHGCVSACPIMSTSGFPVTYRAALCMCHSCVCPREIHFKQRL